jgi:hypothetical protein
LGYVPVDDEPAVDDLDFDDPLRHGRRSR